MRVQTKAPNSRAVPPSSRAACQGLRPMPLPVPGGRLQQAMHPGPPRDARSRRTHRRPAPNRRSARPELSTPLFGLTFRGMHGTRPLHAPRLSSFLAGLSVLALSALFLFPVLAQAEDATGIQYSEAP